MSLASAQLEDLIGDSICGTTIASNGGISSEYSGISTSYGLYDVATNQSSGYLYLALATGLTDSNGASTTRFTGFNEIATSNAYARTYGDATTPQTGSQAGNIAWTSTTAGTFQNANSISFTASSGAWADSNSDGTIIYAVLGYDDTSSNTNYGGSGFSGSVSIPLVACRLKDSGGSDTSITVSASGTTVTFAAGVLKFTVA